MVVIVRGRKSTDDGFEYRPLAVIKEDVRVFTEEGQILCEEKGVETEEDALRAFRNQMTLAQERPDDEVDMEGIIEDAREASQDDPDASIVIERDGETE